MRQTTAEKTLRACQEYDRLMTAIRKNSDDISEGICDRHLDPGGYPDPSTQTHLAEVFAGQIFDDDGEPAICHYTPSEALEIIGDCQACKQAFEAVQSRKENRKKLGAIKRTIRMIGRSS